MTTKELIRRYILFVISLFFAAVGIAFVKRSELGISPVSSISNIISLRYTFFSFGTWILITNCIWLLGEVFVLGKNFKLKLLLQLPLSVVFGWFTDFGVFIASLVPVSSYLSRIGIVVAGILILGFGIALSVIADILLNPAEGFIKTLSDKYGKSFGTIKVYFDIFCVSTSIILSLVMFEGKIIGTREGTLLSALFTGFSVKLFTRIFKNPLEKIMCK